MGLGKIGPKRREGKGEEGREERTSKPEEPVIVGHKNTRESAGLISGNEGMVLSPRVIFRHVLFCYSLISLCLPLVQICSGCQDTFYYKTLSQVLRMLAGTCVLHNFLLYLFFIYPSTMPKRETKGKDWGKSFAILDSHYKKL